MWLGRVISQRKFSKHFFQGNISTCFRNLEQIQKPFNFDEDYCDINYLVWAWVASPCSGNLIWILFKVRFPHRAIHSNLPALKRHLYQEQVFSSNYFPQNILKIESKPGIFLHLYVLQKIAGALERPSWNVGEYWTNLFVYFTYICWTTIKCWWMLHFDWKLHARDMTHFASSTTSFDHHDGSFVAVGIMHVVKILPKSARFSTRWRTTDSKCLFSVKLEFPCTFGSNSTSSSHWCWLVWNVIPKYQIWIEPFIERLQNNQNK